MLTVTKAAKQKLKATLLAHTDDSENSLRLKVKSPGQIGLILDKPAPSDTVIEYEGFKVLLIEKEIGKLFNKSTLDLHKSSDGVKLRIFQE